MGSPVSKAFFLFSLYYLNGCGLSRRNRTCDWHKLDEMQESYEIKGCLQDWKESIVQLGMIPGSGSDAYVKLGCVEERIINEVRYSLIHSDDDYVLLYVTLVNAWNGNSWNWTKLGVTFYVYRL